MTANELETLLLRCRSFVVGNVESVHHPYCAGLMDRLLAAHTSLSADFRQAVSALTPLQARGTELLTENRHWKQVVSQMFAESDAPSQAKTIYAICLERQRQDQLHGPVSDYLDTPFGTGRDTDIKSRNAAQDACDKARSNGSLTLRHIFVEEATEAMAESDPELLRNELVQTAAVCVKMIEIIDAREERAKSEASTR